LGIGVLREEGSSATDCLTDVTDVTDGSSATRSVRDLMDVTDRRKNYQLPITYYPLSITNFQLAIELIG
jgi:hypothetical protein